MHSRRPLIFYTNGYRTWMWDDMAYPPRQVAGFYKKDELARLLLRREQRKPLDVAQVKDAIAGRYYQKRAIGSIARQFTRPGARPCWSWPPAPARPALLSPWWIVLQRAGWVKRALFLADRVSLVIQACNAFKAHLPASSPVNLVTEKETEGRVYVCTYPTMMGLIDETDGGRGPLRGGAFRPGDHRRGPSLGVPEIRSHLPLL
ncbi:MAG: hypothetical protein U5L00_19370 [Desulfovermiculus sp.]|nr:hypothetical protein [Desulfovermiculus sp.]